ncbi:beta-ketoacyl-ACP synthase III [Planctomycetota bacterium]
MIQQLITGTYRLTDSYIMGTGKALPARIVPNSEFEERLETSAQWIEKRTGISERRFAESYETASEYGAQAAQKALDSAGISAEDIDCIVLSTTTPDMRFPSTANIVQQAICAHNAYAYDISTACSGFIFALASAHAQIHAGLARRALVISAELYSSIVDFSDRNTCVLFGDGAGAVVLEGNVNRETSEEEGWEQLFSTENSTYTRGQKSEDRGQKSGIRYPVSAMDSGIIAISLNSEGEHSGILTCEGGGTAGRNGLRVCENKTIRMEGKAVFKLAVRSLAERAQEVLEKADVTLEDVDCIIPHQANIRIIERLARKIGCPMEKMFTNLHKYGNTSSASIPIALDEAYKSGRIQRGDLVLCAAAGAGFSSGAVLLRV